MLAVTIDVEDWYHQPWITGSPNAAFMDVEQFFTEWHERYDYVTEPTKRVLHLLDEINLKTTFFVVGDAVRRYPGLVEDIASRGHEIACHGLYHACKIHPRTKQPLMEPQEFEERTMEAKTLLENASGQEIIGYRAPNGYVAGWMLDALEHIGFKYDSSVCSNSFYSKTTESLKNVGTFPYFPKKGGLEPGGKRGIIELPWPYLKLFGLRFPTAGGTLLRLLGSRYIEKGLRQSHKRGDSVFCFHPIDISTEPFPWKLPAKWIPFWIANGETVNNRIKHILSCINTETGTCRDVYNNNRELLRNDSI